MWRLIKLKENSGAMNMALDEAMMLARQQGKVSNTLRFFTWNPACASIGFFQSLDKEIDIDKTKELGIDVVRRYTGGGAVFHDAELTYSFVLDEKDASDDIIESYHKICKGIIFGLEKLGIKAEFKPINDIIVNGKKISGNAQTRKNKVILQHGTILLDVDVNKMFSILNVPDEKIKDKMIQAVEQRVTSLNKEMGKDTAIEIVQDALIEGWKKAFDVEFEEQDFTEYELEQAKKLYENKYNTKEWLEWR